ncbi:MAG: isoprenylcysteine carboxylmethyltransferase family protein [Anaerolineales bacterium]
MNLLSILLLAYLLLFFGLAFFWRSYRVWRTTGVNPYRLTGHENQQDNLHGLVNRLFRLTLVGTALVVLVYAFSPPIHRFFAPFTWLERPPVLGVGLVFLFIALIGVLVAQIQMGSSWRIGIDTEHATELVTRGIFSRSRNPIFLGMRVMLVGLFLTLPNALTLALWWLGDTLMQVQVYLEEAHLRGLHGEAYEQYRQQVRRWL